MHNVSELDFGQLPKELKLQIEIMKCKSSEELNTFGEEWFVNVDWDNFVEIALHHRIYSFIYPKMKKINKKLIPDRIYNIFNSYFQMNTFKMLQLSGEMEEVSKLFMESGIQSIFLKGPVIAKDLYGDISLRTSSDLDVLIPIKDLEKAEQLLFQQGYIKDDYIETVLNDWKWRHHHTTYFHPEKNVKIEIHWRLNPGPSKEPTFIDLWNRRRKSSLTSYPVYFLGKEDLYLFLVAHGARHGWSRLRWLLDIHFISQQKLDWTKVYRLLKENQFLQVGGQALVLSSQLLNTPLLNEMKPLLSVKNSSRLAQEAIFYLENMINLHSDPIPENVAIYHKRHLFSLMSKQQKLLFISSFLFPYPEDAEVLPLPKQLHLLYFPLRPFLWAWRKTKKYV
ncbi:nucleotidyltransferase family protein [Bacillus sp. T3]|uniref:nucleotidyltransferase domain-containing protein n=1 Tax=Bacillus sp. T3 TaxID=467262 RepID=UPI00298261CF|nr:nucleotidyltransferase family protein [Bacillus sp. T3]